MDNEMLNVYFAVFNRHINDAGKKAKDAFIKRYGALAWHQQMKPFERAGIMSVFQSAPNQFTTYYTDMVHYFVNEKTSLTEKDANALNDWYAKQHFPKPQVGQ
jgi:hypothetical protein